MKTSIGAVRRVADGALDKTVLRYILDRSRTKEI
jgi:hypothetical protein